MTAIKHVLGIDVSTQTVSVMLVGVVEDGERPSELILSGSWTESLPCRDEAERKNPSVWIDLIRQCIADLRRRAPEAEKVEAIGVSTAFPGCFAILKDNSVDPRFASLYDNSDDAGLCDGSHEDILGTAEADTLSRMWPGNMAIGLLALVRAGLNLNEARGIVPPNTAFAHQLLRSAGGSGLTSLCSDFTQTAISGFYDAHTGESMPPGVAALADEFTDRLKTLLPASVPAWRNTVASEALEGVRQLLGLPHLKNVSIGAGDSPLGALALMADRETVVNVRGSSDSPMIMVDKPRPRAGTRETVLHYLLPTATAMADSPWCVVAPMLRSGRVWDWVRSLRFPTGGEAADAELEALALSAFRARGMCKPTFDTALGGERAPLWDCRAKGVISGLLESHGIGDIALAALEGMSQRLNECINMMEDRYDVRTTRLLLVGGPARNRLWNWVTREITGKATFATTFSDASLLGAALLGYAAAYDGREPDQSISQRLRALSNLSARHPLVAPIAVEEPV